MSTISHQQLRHCHRRRRRPPPPPLFPEERRFRRNLAADRKLEYVTRKVLRTAGLDFGGAERKHQEYQKQVQDGNAGATPRRPDESLLGWQKGRRGYIGANRARRRGNASAASNSRLGDRRQLHTSRQSPATAFSHQSTSRAETRPPPAFRKSRQQKSARTDLAPSEKRSYRGQWILRKDILPGDFVELRLPFSEVVRGIALPFVDEVEKTAMQNLEAAVEETDTSKGSTTESWGTSAGTLFILDSRGHITPQRESDVALHIPNFCRQDDGRLLNVARPTLQEIQLPEEPLLLDANGLGLPGMGQTTGLDNVSEDGMWSPFPPFQEASKAETRRGEARARLASILRDFLRETEHKYDNIRKGLYALISNKQWLESKEEVSTLSVAQQLDESAVSQRGQEVSWPSLLATHDLLLENFKIFLASREDMRSTAIFKIRSRRARDDLERVERWIEEDIKSNKGPVASFLAKVIGHLQVVRQTQGTSEAAATRLAWSADDVRIISVLLDGISIARLNQGDLYSIVLSHILKKCEYIPWEQPGSFRNSANPTIEDFSSSSLPLHQLTVQLLEDLAIYPKDSVDWSLGDDRSKDILEKVLELETSHTGNQTNVTHARQDTSADLATVDYDESLRKDFHANVYVIDEASAYELDDGISIEPAKEEGKYWIRAHIADPTSQLLPNDDAASRAKKQGATIYAPLGCVPMFPDSMPGIATKSGADGSRALTFSALVNAQGLIEEYDVGPSLLRNTHVITYSKVNEILQDPSVAPSAKVAEELRILHDYAGRLYKMRIRNGGFLAGNDGVNVVMPPPEELPNMIVPSPFTLVDPNLQRVFNGGRVEVDTSRMRPLSQMPLGLALSSFKVEAKPSSMLVASIMSMANRVAAAFVGKEGPSKSGSRLLLPLRGQSFPASRAKAWLSAIDRMKDEYGNISYRRILRANIDIAGATESTVPVSHISLGITGTEDREKLRGTEQEAFLDAADGWGYTRATSPLRRYSDLVAHWQIKSILHRRASSAASPSQQRHQGISESEMLDLVPRIARQNAALKAFDKFTRKHWTLRAMRLAWESALTSRSSGTPLPAPAPGCISPTLLLQPQKAWIADGEIRFDPQTRLTFVRVQLDAFGIFADCIWPHMEEKMRPVVGAEVEVVFGEIKEHMHGGAVRVSLV
ncbi:RNB-domain-containing protein [Microstroma glucosiphilum]|uniref:RNB-domain-containing protein n=1 Tax=Pseudomicrostroma glucosiphilum TaxID=1684307 RepID=A0A316U2D9_9BASI|nr:RNB-domain-containing protein [Pseudomicrostroma glucosiphilum]PWN18651.1 RNB-domain-containing protein [Pseudomicrostroma glucosiphilum]